MPSFDIVSRTDLAEVDNALNGVSREASQRYDLKDAMCTVERSGNTLSVTAADEIRLKQVHELLHRYFARRDVDSSVLEFKAAQDATKGSLRQQVIIRQGIDDAMSRQIIKMVKSLKSKVQISAQGDELRVNGKKRDDLQETIQAVKEMKLDLPVQFVNFRD
jgi:uncharacterized protein YajQ (UPF0234 family)